MLIARTFSLNWLVLAYLCILLKSDTSTGRSKWRSYYRRLQYSEAERVLLQCIESNHASYKCFQFQEKFSAKCRHTVGRLEFVSLTGFWSSLFESWCDSTCGRFSSEQKSKNLGWTANELWSLREQSAAHLNSAMKIYKILEFIIKPDKKVHST